MNHQEHSRVFKDRNLENLDHLLVIHHYILDQEDLYLKLDQNYLNWDYFQV
jgi:hypothetical protein